MTNKIDKTGNAVKDKITDAQELANEVVNLKTSDLVDVRDFWDKHNFGTRLTLITFVISYLAVVITSFFDVIIPDAVINMVFYSIILAYMTVTLGVNGLKILLNGIAKIKLGK
jgi:hypothetical protein